MGMADLGQIRAGFLADLLLADGDPSQDVSILQSKYRLLAIMKDDVFHKRLRVARTDGRQSAE
jgi:imidazolonepropionase-like amidohydrolase